MSRSLMKNVSHLRFRLSRLSFGVRFVPTCLRTLEISRPIGKRNYAMFSLMVTYGLHTCDAVALTLDDIQWRAGCIRVGQSKTGTLLELPLTPAVSSGIDDYPKNIPRYGADRQIFLRIKAPGAILKGTAVSEAFQACSRESGLKIPFQGAQCLRHSYALHLLRQGLSLKTIGDLWGHRSPESTDVYIRLLDPGPECTEPDGSLSPVQTRSHQLLPRLRSAVSSVLAGLVESAQHLTEPVASTHPLR